MKRMIFILLISLILLGCTSQPKELEPVTVNLKWLHQAQFAGIYAAIEKGIYEEHGIKVQELNEFNFKDSPIDMVQNKKADFAIAGADELILARSEGRAGDIKAIAVIYKINPVCLFSLEESNIKEPRDLIGKRVGIERTLDGKEINVGILYYSMLNNLGIDKNSITEVNIGYDASELLDGKIDVSSGYIINEPNIVREAGKKVNTILPADYGVNMYADVIITHDQTLRDRPKLAEDFLRGTLQGWQYAMENEEETVDLIMRYAKDTTREHQEAMLETSIPLINTGDSYLGMMEDKEWEGAQRLLFSQQILKQPIGPENIYTLEVLEKIYPSSSKKNLEEVSVKLLWLHQNQFVGFYAADQLGYYEKEGIDVKLHSAGYGAPVYEQVISGKEKFGVMHGHEFLKAVSKGAKIKAIAAIYDDDPVVFISKKEKNIMSVQDIRGKKIAFTLSTPERVKIALHNANIDPSEVEFMQKRYGLESLEHDETDVLVGVSFNEQLLAEEKGIGINVLTAKDLMIDSYSNILFTTDSIIEENSSLVEKFVLATIKGWEYAANNPEESSGFVFSYDNSLMALHQEEMLKKSLPYLNKDKLGLMKEEKWQKLIEDMYAVGEIDKKIDPKEIYTNNFIE